MYLEVYVDVLFLINFCMDIIILIILKRILKEETAWYRILLAGIIGAAGSVLVVLFPNMYPLLRFLLMYVIISGSMVKISFRLNTPKQLMKGILLLFVITFFIGGLINSLYYHTDLGFYFNELINGSLFKNINKQFFLCISVIIFISIKVFIMVLEWIKNEVQRIYQVELVINNNKKVVTGLLDTGNSLKDTSSGKPVAVAEYDQLKSLISAELKEYICGYYKLTDTNDSFETKDNSIEKQRMELLTEDAIRIRLIPYRSVGKEDGTLLGIQIDQLNICTKQKISYNKKAIVAVFPGRLSGKKEYHLILHKDLL